MSHKALLLLFVTCAILAKADTMTEYFQGTVLSTTQPGSGSPAFYKVPGGSPMTGSFSFDPSIGTVDPNQGIIAAGVTDVVYLTPITVTMHDIGGSIAYTDIANLEYNVVDLLRNEPSDGGADVYSVNVQGNEAAGVVINLPAGALDDMTLAEFPWGVQPTANCFTSPSVDTCSYAGAGTTINEQASSVLFSVDAVSLTPLSLAPEPSSVFICALGLIGFVAGLKIRQRRSMVS